MGQPYSLLAWVAQPGRRWTLPVRVQRVSSDQTEVEAGVAQVQEDADTPFTVIRIQTHLDRDKPPSSVWLAWQGPEAYPADQLWRFYLQRPTVEHSIRWRNQLLFWTTPEFQDNGPADKWSTLVTLAQWQLYLARTCVPDQPLPWQAPQQRLSPRRVQQGIWTLFH